MTLKLPTPVNRALTMLRTAGFEAYVVGGCVRDSLLHKTPADWDVTTSAKPEQILEVFSSERTIPTGLEHGTVTVLLEGEPIEITTYRIDGAYTDHRHPDAVTFTASLQEDLRRRDFTINALAYSPEEGLVDICSGAADLESHRIVCVGDPETRFTEDALRILRALRFSAVLGFPIEKMTAAALRKLAPLLRRVAAERIAVELKKLLCGVECRRVLLEYPDVLGVVLPELLPMVGLHQENPYHYLTVYEHMAETVQAAPPDLTLRLTMLFHDCGKPQCYTRDAAGVDHFRGHAAISAALAEQALERLRFDRKTIDAVKQLVLHHDDDLPATTAGCRRMLNRFGTEQALALVAVHRADILGQHPDKRERLDAVNALEQQLQQLIDSGCCVDLKALAIHGEDLQAIGYIPGRQLGDTLQQLLEEVMDGQLPNERSALLRRAQQLK